MIGKTLSHFHVTAKLGEGGMGAVYRAKDTKLGREVAIKILPEALTTDPERRARIERAGESDVWLRPWASAASFTVHPSSHTRRTSKAQLATHLLPNWRRAGTLADRWGHDRWAESDL